jgi:hypothetical protein
MVSTNIIEKIKTIQEQAKAIDNACITLLANPNLSEVAQFTNMLEAFTAGQPKPVATVSGKTRNRRTRAQIEAEKAAGDKA